MVVTTKTYFSHILQLLLVNKHRQIKATDGDESNQKENQDEIKALSSILAKDDQYILPLEAFDAPNPEDMSESELNLVKGLITGVIICL